MWRPEQKLPHYYIIPGLIKNRMGVENKHTDISMAAKKIKKDATQDEADIILSLVEWAKDSGILANINVKVTKKSIADAVCKYYNLSFEEVISKNRSRELVDARHIIAYLSVSYYKIATLKSVGNYLGGRDHTTIIHSIRLVKNMIDVGDKLFLLAINTITDKLYTNEQKQ